VSWHHEKAISSGLGNFASSERRNSKNYFMVVLAQRMSDFFRIPKIRLMRVAKRIKLHEDCCIAMKKRFLSHS